MRKRSEVLKEKADARVLGDAVDRDRFDTEDRRAIAESAEKTFGPVQTLPPATFAGLRAQTGLDIPDAVPFPHQVVEGPPAPPSPLRDLWPAGNLGGATPIEEASRELAAEMKKPPPLFQTANGRGAAPGEVVPRDFDGLVETVHAVPDMRKEYAELEAALRIGEKRTDYGTVLRALDEAEDNARRAHRLYLAARAEQARWEIDTAKVAGEMRAAAVSSLEEEKAQRDRRKQITEGDVEGRMATLYPDEFGHQKMKRTKVEGTVKAMERLAELWKGRCFSLRTMLETLRK